MTLIDGRWLSGRKAIASYLGVSVREVFNMRLRGAPIVLENGTSRVFTGDLDRWIRLRDEGRCPRDGSLCSMVKGRGHEAEKNDS